MRVNRSMPPSTVIPVLAYPDAGEAVDWLCEVFGFAERWRAGNHRAQLWVGDGAIAVTGGGSGYAVSPSSVMVRRRRGRPSRPGPSSGAQGSREPRRTTRTASASTPAQDPGGHVWTFSQTIADVAPEDWGGTSRRL